MWRCAATLRFLFGIVAVCFTFLQFMDFDSIFTSFDTPIAPVVSWKDVGKVS